MDKLNVHIESTIEKNETRKFWQRITSAIVVTFYIICFGTSISRTNYISIVASTMMMSAANFIIIFSICRIQNTINKLKHVFLQERYVDVHLMTFCFYSLAYITLQVIKLLAFYEINTYWIEFGFGLMDWKLVYSEIFASNIYYICELWV